jgi:hypothetical protein
VTLKESGLKVGKMVRVKGLVGEWKLTSLGVLFDEAPESTDLPMEHEVLVEQGEAATFVPVGDVMPVLNGAPMEEVVSMGVGEPPPVENYSMPPEPYFGEEKPMTVPNAPDVPFRFVSATAKSVQAPSENPFLKSAAKAFDAGDENGLQGAMIREFREFRELVEEFMRLHSGKMARADGDIGVLFDMVVPPKSAVEEIPVTAQRKVEVKTVVQEWWLNANFDSTPFPDDDAEIQTVLNDGWHVAHESVTSGHPRNVLSESHGEEISTLVTRVIRFERWSAVEQPQPEQRASVAADVDTQEIAKAVETPEAPKDQPVDETPVPVIIPGDDDDDAISIPVRINVPEPVMALLNDPTSVTGQIAREGLEAYQLQQRAAAGAAAHRAVLEFRADNPIMPYRPLAEIKRLTVSTQA